MFSTEKISFIGRVAYKDGLIYRIVYKTSSSRYQLIVYINKELRPLVLRSEKMDDGYKLVSRKEVNRKIQGYVEDYLSSELQDLID